MLTTTVGQLLVNDALPEDMRDHNRTLDKAGMKALFRELAEKHPDQYREVSHKLSNIGRNAAQESGGMGFGIEHLRKSKAGVETRNRIQRALDRILDRDDLDDDQRSELIIRATGREREAQQKAIYEEARKAGNPLARQVESGSRGNKMNLASLLGSDLLYADSSDKPIPVPVLRSYAEGLSPWEYWAGAYGARKGTMATKFATQDAGFLSKQLNQVAHRLVVEDDDYEDEEQRSILRGVPVDTDDMDNEGTLLGSDVGPYKRNTVLTPKVLKHLKRLGHDRIVVRSPMVGGTPSGGVYARDVGVRERGALPGRGEFVGLQAAQALSEPLSQAQLSAKHSGGVAGEEKGVSGFQAINQLVQVPKTFKGGAAHSTLDGIVQRIEPGPAGGNYVYIDDEQHFVGEGYGLKVEKGDRVEAGDVLSEGLPNPAIITRYKGIGEGKRYFTQVMRRAMSDAGLKAHRRNIEILARGLINHVRLIDEYGDFAPDDVVPYSTLEHRWQPREGHQVLTPKQAVGKYLERPVLHYSIGTRIQPSMMRDFDDFGVADLTVHDEEPPFQPEMIRGMYSLQHDPDWMTRLYGSGQKKSLLTAVHRGGTSESRGSSFVPSLATSVDFGRDPTAVVRKPEPPKPIEKIGEATGIPEPPKPPKPPAPAAPAGHHAAPASSAPAVPTAGTSGNPYSQAASRKPALFGGGFRPSASMGIAGTPLGKSFVQGANQFLPGIGGVMAFGSMLDPRAIGVLTSGQRRMSQGLVRGAAGYGANGYQQQNPAFQASAAGGPELGAGSVPIEQAPPTEQRTPGFDAAVNIGFNAWAGGPFNPLNLAIDTGSTVLNEATGQGSAVADQKLDDYVNAGTGSRTLQAISHGMNPVSTGAMAGHLVADTEAEIRERGRNVGRSEFGIANTQTGGRIDRQVNQWIDGAIEHLEAQPDHLSYYNTPYGLSQDLQTHPHLKGQIDHIVDEIFTRHGGTELPETDEVGLARVSANIGGWLGAKYNDRNIREGIRRKVVDMFNERVRPKIDARQERYRRAHQNPRGELYQQLLQDEMRRMSMRPSPPVYSMNPRHQREIQRRQSIMSGNLPFRPSLLESQTLGGFSPERMESILNSESPLPTGDSPLGSLSDEDKEALVQYLLNAK